jgi:hypothetical protein
MEFPEEDMVFIGKSDRLLANPNWRFRLRRNPKRKPGDEDPSQFLGNAGRLALVCGFFRRNIPMPNDTYHVTFPLRIAEISVEDLTE